MNNAFHTLRIALTHEDASAAPLLPFEQIHLIAKSAFGHGIRRIELSGGEPLMREDIPVLVMMLSSLAVWDDMTLTTDGLLLPRWAKALRGAGVRSVTVKLDTFDPSKYRMLTGGGDITAALTGVRTLAEVGFPPATMQARLIRGVNDDEIPSLVRLTKLTGVSLRLMEMTQEEAASFGSDAHMTCREAYALVPELSPAEEDENTYRLPGAAGTVTLIPCTQREAGCVVLTADGTLCTGGRSIHLAGLDETGIESGIAVLLSK